MADGQRTRNFTGGTDAGDYALGVVLYDSAGAAQVGVGTSTAVLVTAVGTTTTQTSADQTNAVARGVKVVLDMTAVGTGSVTLTIQGKAPTSGKYFTLLAGAAVVTNSTNVYTVYPGAAVTANVSANDVLPRTWRVVITANNANPVTYVAEALLLV